MDRDYGYISPYVHYIFRTGTSTDKISIRSSTDDNHIFPNWVATFEDKTMHLFPMMAPNRRLEKTPQMIDELSKEFKLVEDLSHYEQKNIFLEYVP